MKEKGWIQKCKSNSRRRRRYGCVLRATAARDTGAAWRAPSGLDSARPKLLTRALAQALVRILVATSRRFLRARFCVLVLSRRHSFAQRKCNALAEAAHALNASTHSFARALTFSHRVVVVVALSMCFSVSLYVCVRVCVCLRYRRRCCCRALSARTLSG